MAGEENTTRFIFFSIIDVKNFILFFNLVMFWMH